MQMGLAAATDAIRWTRHPANPPLRAGGPASWDWTLRGSWPMGHVTLEVLDVTGRTVATLVDEERAPGRFQRMWIPALSPAASTSPG